MEKSDSALEKKKNKNKSKFWLGYSEKFHIEGSIVQVKLGKRVLSLKVH